MTVIAAESFAISDRKAVLKEITAKNCSLAIWQRNVPFDAHSLLYGDPDNLRISVPSDLPEPRLHAALDDCGFPDNRARQELAEDISALCHDFNELITSPLIEIRLEVVTDNSCWKFHCDYVEMRLITTYLGQGTQWIDERNARRVADGLEPEEISELCTGDVGLFKGRLGNGLPAIHRSPPIDGSGEKRLLLVLNPVES